MGGAVALAFGGRTTKDDQFGSAGGRIDVGLLTDDVTRQGSPQGVEIRVDPPAALDGRATADGILPALAVAGGLGISLPENLCEGSLRFGSNAEDIFAYAASLGLGRHSFWRSASSVGRNVSQSTRASSLTSGSLPLSSSSNHCCQSKSPVFIIERTSPQNRV